MKTSMNLLLSISWLLILIVISSSQTSIPETVLPERFVDPENLIHIGDLLDVDFVGSTEFDWRGTMNPEGFLSQVGFFDRPIFALCRSEEAVAADIVAAFSKNLRNPTVEVKIVDRSNRSLSSIFGAVKTPQRFKFRRAVRLSELIVLSGGLTDKAAGEIQIIRPANVSCDSAKLTETEIVNIQIRDLLRGGNEANPIIRVGDIVNVKESVPVYVMGGVRNPRQILFRDNLTLSRAINSAGGLAANADSKQISIYRRNGKQSSILLVDLEQISSKKFVDIDLQKYDIVDVGVVGKGIRTAPLINGFSEKSSESSILPIRIIE